MKRVLLGLLTTASVAKATGAVPVYRADLAKHMAYFCSERPQELIEKPMSDAQIELAFVKAERELKEVALDFATENKHLGYAFGTCPGPRPFVVSTPSPEPIIELKDGTYLISERRMKHCARSETSMIQEDSAFPRTLDKNLAKVVAKGVNAISVSCVPIGKPNSGPELWALLTPKFESVAPKSSISDVIRWINLTRKTLKLSELKESADLDLLAKEALQSKTLEHPRALLLEKKSKLAKEKIHLLGENRAISASFTGLANLFWNSPQHRSLLLNAKANAIGYAIEEVHGQSLLVLVLAKVEP